jgi:hypothetical protein
MARNQVFDPTGTLSLPVPDGTESGDPLMVFDKIPAVALTDRGAGGNASTHATCAISPSWVFDLPVKGEDDAGNATLDAGDVVAEDSDGEFNGDVANGRPYGIALEAVPSGTTTTIRTLLLPPQGEEA